MAIERREAAFISEAARERTEAGANYIDVNADTFEGQS
jgi:cobalamin-dependent methionine synthase I